ncbi:MAG TPA: PPK2 family polyphosphate kinase [Candidatus Dormibacteraeota bacterium]|jgi:PPK2 family polyphosphate:nucleotide phosphotransferase
MSPKASSMRDLLRAPAGRPFSLAEVDPGERHDVRKRTAAIHLEDVTAELQDLQERLWAEHRRAVLVVLQGMDTSGKDGTIEHVMGGLNPQGVRVQTFKAPTPEELRHDFLWRIRRVAPGPGLLGIFNRSHYEDVLIARVDRLVPDDVIEVRYAKINRFEAELAGRGVRLLKVMLHISFEEQRRRLVARLKDPDKRWKFEVGDIDKRAQWSDYQAAYDVALARCSTPDAPWYVVPADAKWYRNYAVSRLLLETLREMAPRYPRPRLNVPKLLRRLEPEAETAGAARTA